MQGIRGATTIEVDSREEIDIKTKELLEEIMQENDLEIDDIIYIMFTATDDITSAYPAVAAREIGMDKIPLICCQEMKVDNSLNLCIRVLMLVQRTERAEVFHIYKEEAISLRPDIINRQRKG
ncbi:MAG: chorismate mutase [Clostridiales bacterium]|nr:chorismate mutase [Clostridiales bacterium]